jgi:P2-related tail formation protein
LLDCSIWSIEFWYDGEPYTFRVNISLMERGMDEAAFDALIALIAEYKNVRSHLSGLTIRLTNVSRTPVIAVAMLGGELVSVYPHAVTDLDQASHSPRVGVGYQSVETVHVYPHRSSYVQ